METACGPELLFLNCSCWTNNLYALFEEISFSQFRSPFFYALALPLHWVCFCVWSQCWLYIVKSSGQFSDLLILMSPEHLTPVTAPSFLKFFLASGTPHSPEFSPTFLASIFFFSLSDSFSSSSQLINVGVTQDWVLDPILFLTFSPSKWSHLTTTTTNNN